MGPDGLLRAASGPSRGVARIPDTADRSRWKRNDTGISPWVVALVIFSGVVWSDTAIKAWAAASFHDRSVCPAEWFCLKTHYNSELVLGYVYLSPALWLVVCGALVWVMWRMVSARVSPINVGYALVAGGFTGNVLGHVRGGVVDYAAFGPVVGDKWVFANLADLAIVGGLVILSVALIANRSSRSGVQPTSGRLRD